MMMMPAGVVTAHAEYSVCPPKDRMSNTFTGFAYQVSRAGAPVARGVTALALGAGGVHRRVTSPPYSDPAAAFAAATCPSMVSGTDCAPVMPIAMPFAIIVAMRMLVRFLMSTAPLV